MEMSLLATSLLERSKDAKPGESTPAVDSEHAQIVSSLEKLIYDSSYEHHAAIRAG